MRKYFVLPLLFAAVAAPVGVYAQDVPAISSNDADTLLADPPASADSAVDTAAPARARRSSAVRGFSFIPTQTANTPARKNKVPVAGATGARKVPLQFNVGSFELSPQSKANMQTLASALNAPANRGKRIGIFGHTDKSGSLEANRRLSQQRADAAATYLAGLGVERSRIDAKGRGYEDPLPGVSAFSPRQRRVEITRLK